MRLLSIINRRSAHRSLAIAVALTIIPPPATAATAPVVASYTGYADLADLALSAPVIVLATITSASRLKPEESPGVKTGQVRFYVTARVTALLKGRDGVPPDVSYLADVPLEQPGNRAEPEPRLQLREDRREPEGRRPDRPVALLQTAPGQADVGPVPHREEQAVLGEGFVDLHADDAGLDHGRARGRVHADLAQPRKVQQQRALAQVDAVPAVAARTNGDLQAVLPREVHRVEDVVL